MFVTHSAGHYSYIRWPATASQWPVTALEAMSHGGEGVKALAESGTGRHAMGAISGVRLATASSLRLISFYLLSPGRHNRNVLQTTLNYA